MMEPGAPIAAVQGAPSAVIQELFWTFIASISPVARVVGLLEEQPTMLDRGSDQPRLRSLTDERRYPIFQDLGANSRACGLDGESVVTACEAVRRDIRAGCDLAQRTGLSEAFVAGMDAQARLRRPTLRDASARGSGDPALVAQRRRSSRGQLQTARLARGSCVVNS